MSLESTVNSCYRLIVKNYSDEEIELCQEIVYTYYQLYGFSEYVPYCILCLLKNINHHQESLEKILGGREKFKLLDEFHKENYTEELFKVKLCQLLVLIKENMIEDLTEVMTLLVNNKNPENIPVIKKIIEKLAFVSIIRNSH